MSKLKIAIYTRSFPPKSGGVSTAHYNIYNLLKDTYEVKMFVYDENDHLTQNHVVKRKTIPWINHLILIALKWKYKSKKKDVVFNNVKNIVGAFIPVLKLNKQLKAFNPNIIIVPDNFLPAYMLKKPKGSKLVSFAHHNYERFTNQPLLEQQDWLDLEIACSMERKVMYKVDAVISPSQYMIDCYKDTTYADKPIFQIPNFMESRVFGTLSEQSKKESVIPADKKVIYIPSAGSDVKGQRYVFEIIRRLLKIDTDVFFYLSGHIPEDLKYELKSYDKNIYAPGHVAWEDNIKNVMHCYMGITPNIEENFSYAILEAQASGLPILTFDTGGNKEIIINQVTGFIVPYLDIEALIDKSVELLKNEDLCKVIKTNASEKYHKRFNDNRILEQYYVVLNEIQNLSIGTIC